MGAAPDSDRGAYVEAATHASRIRAELAASNPAVLVLDREFETQSVDPMFLEPETGSPGLHMGAKTSNSCRRAVAYEPLRGCILPQLAPAPFKPAHMKTLFAYMGGDSVDATTPHSRLCPRWLRSSLPGRPGPAGAKRPLSAFQGGIKLTPSRSVRGSASTRDPADQWICRHHVRLGLANFSSQLASVGAHAAVGIYDIPRSIYDGSRCIRGRPEE